VHLIIQRAILKLTIKFRSFFFFFFLKINKKIGVAEVLRQELL
jgi:hypothetical protein